MMNVTYGVTEEVYYLGSSSRTFYGIAAYVNAAYVGTATVVTVIHDITSDRDALLDSNYKQLFT